MRNPMDNEQIVTSTGMMTQEQIDDMCAVMAKKKPLHIRIINRIKYLFRWIKNGFPDSDTWSLDITIAKYTLPRLKRLKELKDGYPSDMTEQQWDEILDKMIFAMDYLANDGEMVVFDKFPFPDKPWDELWVDDADKPGYKLYEPKYNQEEEKMIVKHMEESKRIGLLVQEGCELFGKHFLSLWW
jgi:hypothetical protein